MSTAPSACGWLRGTSRTSPGPPRRWLGPVWLRGTFARGRGFAAYLSGCARQLLTVRCAHYAGEASLTTFGFVTIVPRYLLPQVIPSHSFAALTALVVRRVKGIAALFVRRVSGDAALFMYCISGDADLPIPCLYWLPARPRRGIGGRTRQRHLAAVPGGGTACCAPRKRYCGLICAPCKWEYRTAALTCGAEVGFAAPPGFALRSSVKMQQSIRCNERKQFEALEKRQGY